MFESEEISTHRMKTFFLCNLWSCTKLHAADGPNSLIDFLIWMGCE